MGVGILAAGIWMIRPNANAGPALAAVAIAFNNDPEIFGAMTAILLMGLVATGVIGAWMGNDDSEQSAAEAGASTAAATGEP